MFVRLRHAVNLGAPDGVATRYIFLLLGASEQVEQHLDLLSAIARLMSDNVFHFETTYATTQQEVVEALDRHLERNMLSTPPRPRTVSEGLSTSSRPMAGIVNDVRRRLPYYIDDFRSGLQPKCLASIIFLFFACIAPAVTFGGIMGLATDSQIGPSEMLIATATCGILYALLAGQPLIILGGIGPLLIFTIILYELCVKLKLEFLSVYGWVGLWTALFTILLAVTNASNLMKYFTRFTDEIFSALMSLIFIYKAIEGIQAAFARSFSQDGVSHDVAFLSLILALGTFYIATSLAGFRRSQYLVPWIREFLADFGPSIALGLMTLLAWWLRDEVTLETLSVSHVGDEPRPWFVNLGGVPGWVMLAAAGPAALATVLVFLSQNITARLLNSPSNKLMRGESYHWDLALVGLLTGVCSMFGWPWLVAATVRSLAHVRALADSEEIVGPNGGSREHIIHVNENRVTGLAIHLLIAGTLFVLPLLEYIPMATLYGIFLFMGFASLRGVQFIERMSLWIMDSSLYPVTHYTRRVPIRTIHIFTAIQLVCLIVLCIVNVSPYKEIAILFPVFIALLVPVRAMMSRFFDSDELAFLDADEEPEAEENHWV